MWPPPHMTSDAAAAPGGAALPMLDEVGDSPLDYSFQAPPGAWDPLSPTGSDLGRGLPGLGGDRGFHEEGGGGGAGPGGAHAAPGPDGPVPDAASAGRGAAPGVLRMRRDDERMPKGNPPSPRGARTWS